MASALPGTATPPEPPKPGSAREEMFKKLRAKAQGADPAPPETKREDQPPAQQPPAAKHETDENLTDEAVQQREEAEAVKSGDRKRMGPWKLVQQYKQQLKQRETEIGELRKSGANPVDTKQFEERVTKAEARAKELEDHIRYVDYTKSSEFTEKYEKPYESAWKRAMSELGELEVSDPSSGERRPATTDDLVELVSLPVQQAKERAREIFGDFCEEAMAHRKDIKQLFDAKNEALKNAKQSSEEYFKKKQEDAQRQTSETTKFIAENWKKLNDEAPKDPKHGVFFAPKEGDEEGNKRLQKGYELADRAFSLNSMDPRLTPQQRIEAIRVHSAIRNRAAAYGRMVYWLEQERAAHQATKAELEKYRSANPGAGEGARAPGGDPAATSAKESVFGALRKLAR